jgi:hypothetical protein
MVEIHESVCGPEFFLKLFASNDFAGVLEQHRQNAEGLCLKPNLQAALAQFASAKIQFENPKTDQPVKVMGFLHRKVNLSRKEVYHPAEITGTRGGDIIL